MQLTTNKVYYLTVCGPNLCPSLHPNRIGFTNQLQLASSSFFCAFSLDDNFASHASSIASSKLVSNLTKILSNKMPSSHNLPVRLGCVNHPQKMRGFIERYALHIYMSR